MCNIMFHSFIKERGEARGAGGIEGWGGCQGNLPIMHWRQGLEEPTRLTASVLWDCYPQV